MGANRQERMAILYYSKHHENTKKVLNALHETDRSLVLVDVTGKEEIDLNPYDRIGLASGMYFGKVATQLVDYAIKNLPEGKDVFFLTTHGAPLVGGRLGSIKKVVKAKHCKIIGKFHCRGYDTYVFKKRGGIAKGHPNGKDIQKAIRFYEKLR